ncbi:hypothetical protein [Tepidibacter mesophilus]|uniref:hypothetical protein n=1 Tax=Tepidibacter mesophilus TaxID=655607 RepID=UPI000C071DD5|nr:hypothetical protein [Tepidibacter mesophilus]
MNEVLSDYIEWCKEPCKENQAIQIKNLYENERFQKLYKYTEENPNVVADVLKILGSFLNKMDISKACATAHFCGALIESNNVFDIENNLIDLFEKVINLSAECITKMPDINNVDWNILFKNFPNEVKAYHGSELLTLAIMAVITRTSESRYYLREKKLYQKLELLEPYIRSIVYVTFVHDACYDFKVLLLAPETKKGFWMKVHDIHNCFYLFTLLEAELYKKGWHNDYGLKDYIFNEEIYNTAIGTFYPKKVYTIEAHCSYQTYLAIKGQEEKSNLRNMIFGEMPPEYLPKLKGCPIIVMKEDNIKGRRSWDSNFSSKCHDGLSPHIEILEKLTEKEVEEWIDSLLNKEQEKGIISKIQKFIKSFK